MPAPRPLCSVCAQRPARSAKVAEGSIHRCNTCNVYFHRHGYDRSVAMTDGQRDRALVGA